MDVIFKVGRYVSIGDVLVGESNGTSEVYGKSDSSAMPGLIVLETEHGSLYIDPDAELTVRAE